MRKLILSIIFLAMLFTACDSREDQVLKGFSNCEEYYSDGFQDYTDYCKYYYSKKEDEKFAESHYYSIVTKENIDNIKKYFNEFPSELMGDSNMYDFDFTKITEGDYYNIKEDSNDDNYSVYLYDSDEHVLYYIHYNR